MLRRSLNLFGGEPDGSWHRSELNIVEVDMIAEALKYNSSLTSLNFSSSIIGEEGAAAIAEALKLTHP